MPTAAAWSARLLALISVAASIAAAQHIPVTQGTALDGSSISLPKPDASKPLLLVVGFSHKSNNQFKNWNQRLKPAYGTEARLDWYELADFQSVSSFTMHLVMHGMRRSVPKPQWPHFILFQSAEDDWKKLVGFSSPDDAYVVVADGKGNVLWQTHGPPTDAGLADLQSAIAKLLPKP
jgi:hypothetical protein